MWHVLLWARELFLFRLWSSSLQRLFDKSTQTSATSTSYSRIHTRIWYSPWIKWNAIRFTMSISSQLSDSDYGFNDSPSTSLLLEQATMSMTLSEKFNMTRFRDYQKKKPLLQFWMVKTAWLYSQQAVENHYAFSFHQFIKTKRLLWLLPQSALWKTR